MNTDLQQIGAVLASHVDMAKGFLGPQFAVSIIARHKSGPFHLLLGDDAELALIQCLSELQRIGKHLIRVGEDGSVVPVEPGDDDAPTEWDHMVNLIREIAEEGAHWDDDQLAEFRQRAAQVLDMVTPEPQTGPGPGQIWIDDGPSDVEFVPIVDTGLTPSDPTGGGVNAALIGDMADAPAADGRPEGRKVCNRCVEPLEPGMTKCPCCGDPVPQ